MVNLLGECGNRFRKPYSEHLEDGIFELRAKAGSDISRDLYFFVIGKQIVLTNGFIKNTQKTPRNAKKRNRACEKIQERISEQGEIKMTNFKDFLYEQLKDKDLKKEYDALEPEFTIIKAMIDARKDSGMTQRELSEKTGINQADISKLENGTANPSLRTLQRLAEGMGMVLKLEFVRPASRK